MNIFSVKKEKGYACSKRVRRIRSGRTLKYWESALLLALCISSCAAAWAQSQQSSLASAMVRLHVVAQSDDEYEQALKLRVRDAVLAEADDLLQGASDLGEVEEKLLGGLDGIKTAAESKSEGRNITVTLQEEYFPTREYETFSLPAGKYMSLRVIIGEGRGHNWWCVVFPPLCITSAEPAAAAGALTDGQTALITGRDEGYVLRFRIVELWGELCGKLDKR